jgi:Fe-S cluster assembly protein SufD
MKKVALLHQEKEVQELHVPAGEHFEYFFVFVGSEEQEITRSMRFALADDAELAVMGLVLGADHTRMTLRTEVRHEGVRTRASTHIRGVLTDRAYAHATGWITIPKTGHQTDAHLEQRFLLLSPHARAKAEPILEILADDVKAAHAATVSKLDPEQLFYLTARGIHREDGRRMLTRAFVEAALCHMESSEMKKAAEAALESML